MRQRASSILLPIVLTIIFGCAAAGLAVWGINSYLVPGAPVASGPATQPPAAQSPPNESPPTVAVPAHIDPAPADAAYAAEKARVELYRRVGPAVVSIEVSDVSLDPESAPSIDELIQSQGSGFLIDSEGHIVTNNHVVEGARTVYVTFASGVTVAASIVGTDPDSDLAVIKVPADKVIGITPISLANSNEVEVGQDTIAIGNPYGLQNTMTMGIVSAVKGRTLPGRELANGGTFAIAHIIQTDAAINPGNSGGPLLDSSGNLIGVNTAIRVSPGADVPTFGGIGYAVPSNTVAAVVPDLIEHGKHVYAYLGVRMFNVTPQLAAIYELKVDQGVLLTEAVEGEAASNAGLRVGRQLIDLGGGVSLPIDSDIVVAFNGEPVLTSDDLLAYVSQSQVGETVTLRIQRGDEQLDVQVTLGRRPEE